MKRLAWLTDLHLNSAAEDRIARFCQQLRDAQPDAVLIGGDIGEAPDFAGFLQLLAGALSAPIYFVLGNHDYYRGSIAGVRAAAAALSRDNDNLCWLPQAGVVSLAEKTSLVGHGGWGDGRLGNFLGSGIMLNDYVLSTSYGRRTVRLSPCLGPC